MAYTIEWYIPDRILNIQFGSELSLEDISKLDSDIRSHFSALSDSPHKIHLIADLSTLRKIPISSQEIRKRLGTMRHANAGTSVLYDAKAIIALILRAVLPFVQPYVYYAQDIESALTILLNNDPSLQDLLPQRVQYSL
jgi:hypothetical protein